MTVKDHFNQIADATNRDLALKAMDRPDVPVKTLSEAYLRGISEMSEKANEPYEGYFFRMMNDAGIKQMKR